MAITLLDMLLNAGLITRDQFDEALRNRVVFGGKIGTSLIELGFVKEEDLARFLSSKLEVPYVPPERLLAIPQEVIGLIPRDTALKYRVIPIHRDAKKLYLIMTDPADLKAIEDIGSLTGLAIRPLITPEVRLVQALGKYYQLHIDRRYQHIIDRMEQEKQPSEEPVASEDDEAGEPEIVEPLELPGIEEELEEAEVVIDEKWVERIDRFSIDSVSRDLAQAEDREVIANVLLNYLGQEFDRVALLVVRGETVFGWKGVIRGAELQDFDRVAIPLDSPSVFKTVVDGKGYYLGAIPCTAANLLFVQAIGGASPPTALFLPLMITGRVAAILYLEGGGKELGERFGELHRLLAKAALAFEILIFREKILMI